MMKKLLFLGCFLSLFASLNAQTNLSAGDIAIIGVNYDTSPYYELTIVTLAPIAANTQIRISDYWYNENTPDKLTNVQASSGNAVLTSEGAILWQPLSAIPAGTVYKISILQGSNTVLGLPGNVSVTGWSTSAGTPSSQGGDNWFIYQGTSATNVTTFVFLWGNASNAIINNTAIVPGQFVTPGSISSLWGTSDLSNNNVTYRPPSLTLGTYAIALTVDPNINGGIGFHTDNNIYTGIKSGTKAALLTAICNKDNWDGNETTTYDITPGGANFSGINPIFTVTGANSAPTDIALTASSINENVAANSTVGTLSSTDANAGNTFDYSLVTGTGDTDNAAFSINNTTKTLTINASPDFETKSSYSVRVRTTDQGSLFFEKTFTITINNVNEAPTDIALSASAINENVLTNSIVGTLSSTDVDSSSFTYTLVAGAGSTDNASFNISGSSLRITASPDFETKSSYSVRVSTFDGTSTFEKTFTITINDLNEAPTDMAISASSINENVAANSTVGTLSSTDVDSSSFTYTLVAGTGSTDNASFNISGSSLRITASPDFETKSSYSVRVRTTDQGLLFFEKTFTITINNLNEAPTNIALSASAINENVAANSTVGTLSSTDPDAASTFTYTLVAGTGDTDNAAFNISGSNLRINASPNFETKSSYSVRVRTSDGSLTFDKVFTITVNNVNEVPTDIALSASAINENIAANSTVGTLSSTDVDSSSFTYTLVAGTGDTDNAAFNISGSNLRITASPDFETKSSYSVRVRTSDGSLTFDKVFTITINNVNETPTDIALSASAINENVAANSTVGTLSSTDPDAASTFTYTLVAGTGDTDNAAFNISGSNLRITASPNFETKSSYSVRVRTSDGSLTFDKVFTITITNINEAPTDIALSASAINENVVANSTVGTLSSTDVDSSTFTYTLVAGTGDTDNAAFNISGSNLRITASPDFETKSSYSVRVRTSDGSLTFDKVFNITITNVNEAPTDIALSASAINENVAANSTVGTLSSTDVDSSPFTYTLVTGTGDTDNAAFTISGSDLKINASPDFETKSSYSVRVRTSDGSLTFDKVFTITVNNVNEAPTDIALSASAINENVAANSTVGTLSSTDVDSSSFTYTLVAGTGDTDNAAFTISGSDLKINASPDFETKSSYSIRVRTSDGSLTFDKVFIITITNVNETPTDIALSASAINENVAANSTVGTLSSTDVDSSSFTYTLVAGTGDTDNAAFTISGSDLKINASPDFETKSSYSIRVRTSDGSLTFDKVFTITITNVNETPTDIALSASAINENVAANSTVGTLSSTDVDSSSFTYTLVAGTGDTDNAAFTISGSNLRITASPDFETKSSYSIRVRTSDGSLTFDKVFTITITNVNETPTDIALTASSINENVAANSTVGTLSSTDVDSSSFTYTLVAGTGDTDNAAFTISGSDLKINASPDFETKASYSIRVSTFDGTSTFVKVFTITINDLCDLNNLVTLTSGVLTATQTGATYQWRKCSDNSPVGTDSNTYTPTVIGDYKVDITSGSCTITSTCVTVSTLGTTDFETNAKLLIYPNPSKGIVNINSDTEDTFQITNQLGQTVKTFKVKANVLNTINVENLTDGIYFVKNSNNNKSYKLIIKK